MAPAAGTKAGSMYQRALMVSGVLPAYGGQPIEGDEPLQVFGIRDKNRAKKKLRKNSRKRSSRKRSTRIVCKQQMITTPQGKRVRRKVCRNSLGQIVSNKSRRKKRRK